MAEDEVFERLRVRTPEGVTFSFCLASPVTRFAAWAVDKLAISATWTVLALLIQLLGVISVDLVRGVLIVAYFVLSTGYAIALEWHWNGQTLGKRLFRLRVMDERGLPLRFPQVVVRNLVRVADALPFLYLLGGATAMLNGKAQRLGDIAGATIVVREPVPSDLPQSGLELSRYNSLRGQQHLAARLRAKVSPALAQAARSALLRREQMEAADRVALFADFARHFRSLTPLPPDLEEGISDEVFVKNVVEVLFGLRPPAVPAPGLFHGADAVLTPENTPAPRP